MNHPILSSFNHDSKIDPKEAEIESMKNESERLAIASLANCLSLNTKKKNYAVGYVIG